MADTTLQHPPEGLSDWPCHGACSPTTWPALAFVCSAYSSEHDALCTRYYGHDRDDTVGHIACPGDDRHAVAVWHSAGTAGWNRQRFVANPFYESPGTVTPPYGAGTPPVEPEHASTTARLPGATTPMTCCGGFPGEHFADFCPILSRIARYGGPSGFWGRVAITPGQCWEWQGFVRSDGYTQFGRNLRAHRVAYELSFGPVPEGLHVDHLCRNTRCVNPDHLEAVTRTENLSRQFRAGAGGGANNARKTHCPAGHPYSDENTYTDPHGRRHCRTCDAPRKQAYEARRRNTHEAV